MKFREERFVQSFVDKPKTRKALLQKASLEELKALIEFILNFSDSPLPPKRKAILTKKFKPLLKQSYKNLEFARKFLLKKIKILSELIKIVLCSYRDKSICEFLTHG